MNITKVGSVIQESVLKTAQMPVRASNIQRDKMAMQAVDRFYRLFTKEIKTDKSYKREISSKKIFEILKKIFPNIDLRISTLRSKTSFAETITNINDDYQVTDFEVALSLKKKKYRVSNNSVGTLLHEITHLAESVYKPKHSASNYEFERMAIKRLLSRRNLNEQIIVRQRNQYDKIYSNLLYECEIYNSGFPKFVEDYKKGGKIRKKAIERRIIKFKKRYVSEMAKIDQMTRNEKILRIKTHLRMLEEELKAHKTGIKYDSKFLSEHDLTKRNQAQFRKKKDERIHMQFLFPEKIKVLKELLAEEIKRTRAEYMQ